MLLVWASHFRPLSISVSASSPTWKSTLDFAERSCLKRLTVAAFHKKLVLVSTPTLVLAAHFVGTSY